MSDSLDLFGDPTGGIPMTRTPDSETSHIAAAKVRPGVSDLQRALMRHIQMMQPVTAMQLEELPPFRALAPSTVRKRISELKARGQLWVEGKASYTSPATGRTSVGEALVLSVVAVVE